MPNRPKDHGTVIAICKYIKCKYIKCRREMLEMLYGSCNQIYNKKDFPEDWERVIIVSIHKKR